jgi:SAM-dependent methyltransferase
MSIYMSSGAEPEGWTDPHGRYDRQLWLERAAVSVALDLARPEPLDGFLDLATGTGAVLRELARRPARPRHAVGIDASASMLAQVPPLPHGWTVQRGDAGALPFDAGAFDVSVASYVLHLLPHAQLATALSELARVLRPGGRLVTVTPILPTRGLLRPLALAGDTMARRGRAWAAGLRTLDPQPALERAGFDVIRVRSSKRGYASLCVLAHAPRQCL